MTKLEQIEKTIEELDPKDFEKFSNWFQSLVAERWDRQLEADAESGKLDDLAARALTAHRAGKTTRM